MDYTVILRLVIYYLSLPILFILKFIGILLLALAAPILHLGQFVLDCCLWPLRLLARFEVEII